MARKKVLVAGATGKQGGSVARALLARGHQVTGFVRRTDTEAGRALRALGVNLVRGDLLDRSSVIRALEGKDAFFFPTLFDQGLDAEVRMGQTAVDAAMDAGVEHVVYSSVASADQHTGIPHFETKARVEEHLVASGVRYTIVAPVFFMENLLSPWMLPQLRENRVALAITPDCKLQQVGLEQIGRFVALAIDHPDRFEGRRFDIASDSVSGNEMAAILSRVTGRPISYAQVPIEQVRSWSPDFATMFEWFEQVGYSVDIEALRREFPDAGFRTFEEWARGRDWSELR